MILGIEVDFQGLLKRVPTDNPKKSGNKAIKIKVRKKNDLKHLFRTFGFGEIFSQAQHIVGRENSLFSGRHFYGKKIFVQKYMLPMGNKSVSNTFFTEIIV